MNSHLSDTTANLLAPSPSTAGGARRRAFVAWMLIGLGSALRLAQYHFNRSFWYDEANLALNIRDRSMLGLLQPLANDQGAPQGFLVLEKIVGLLLSYRDDTLRLIPLLAGVLALVLFYPLAKRVVHPQAVPIAVYLFAVSETLIYYTSEAKQYSTDVLITLLLFFMAYHVLSAPLTIAKTLIFGCLGAAAIWFAYPAIFLLGSIGIVSISRFGDVTTWSSRIKLASIYVCWCASFALNYGVALKVLERNGTLRYYWQENGGFMPFPPTSLRDVEWFLFKLFDTFADPGGLKLFSLEVSGVAVAAFLIGATVMFRENRRQLAVLLLPGLFALGASGLHRYPFSGRMLLFLVPALLLLVAQGVADIWRQWRPSASVSAVILISVLVVPPAVNAVQYLIHPRTREEIRATIEYIQAHQQVGDVLYVYPGAQPGFAYYPDRDTTLLVVPGVDAPGNWQQIRSNLHTLHGHRRVWLLFAHVRNVQGIDEEQFVINQLDAIGVRRDIFGVMGASAYLYDLSATAGTATNAGR